MFKFVFRIMFIVVFLIILIIALAVWKGGDSFRWIGKKTESAGRAISGFGNVIDGVKEGTKKAGKTLEEIKEGIGNKKDKKENESIDNRKRPE